jgi:hypothetical protein
MPSPASQLPLTTRLSAWDRVWARLLPATRADSDGALWDRLLTDPAIDVPEPEPRDEPDPLDDE